MKSTAFSKFIFTIACSLFLLIIFLSGNQTQAAASFVLDGLPDTDYAAAITTDPSADLASPGPADWAGTHWSDLTNLYCGHDGTNLFVYASAPSYSQTTSSGQIGLLIDSTATSGTGGSAEPWNNAISFSHSNLPHYIIRGNIPGITDPPNSNNGWTELRSWNGSSWSAGGTNWGGITDPNQVGSHIAYANAQGVEFKIPFSDIGISATDTVWLQLFSTQSGASKGAYDTLPTDDQSTNWDDATIQSVWATCTLDTATPTSTPTGTVTPTETPTPTVTPSITPTPPANCGGTGVGDGNIATSEIYHLDSDINYRDPQAPIPQNGSSTITLRTCSDDVQTVEILVWKTGDPLSTPSNTYALAIDTVSGADTFWQATVPGPGALVDQWYQFRVTDGGTQGYYHPASGNHGIGIWSATLIDPSWHLPTDMPATPTPTPIAPYAVPDWVQDAVIYQIFPDRFRNGDSGNDPVDGAVVYEPGGCSGYPHPRPGGATSGCLHDIRSWNDPLYIPSWGLDFYGGDLQGVIDKINDGYFTDLGVNTLYLNPVFDASSNHGYDTNDYHNVRAYFGDNATFDAFVTAANNANLRIVLDAVFNHGGMDSLYLDPFNRWAGTDGACESAASPYRSWFETGSNGTCDGGWGWQGWFNYATLPEFVDNSSGVRDHFFRGGAYGSPSGKSVSQFWQDKGIAGWRYDVAQDITHDFFNEMRPYVKGDNLVNTVYGADDVLMLGEVTGGCDWYLYQSYLNADELDSVMNYCFRDWTTGFVNGDSPTNFSGAYTSFRALFPEPTFYAMMNLISTHDSPRMLSLVGENKARLKLAVLLQMTLPGAPSVYYGDEVGLPGGSDPDNRRVYPWADTGGGQSGASADTDMYNHFKAIISHRNGHTALRRGSMEFLPISGTGAASTLAYMRQDAGELIIVALNNGESAVTTAVSPPAYVPDGTLFTDLLDGSTYSVSAGELMLPLDAVWGRILVSNSVVVPTAVGLRSEEINVEAYSLGRVILLIIVLSFSLLAIGLLARPSHQKRNTAHKLHHKK